MEGYVKVFEAKTSEAESMIELGCLKETLEKNWIQCHIIYRCYFDDSDLNSCLYLQRPEDPETCQRSLCSRWLKRLAKSLQPGLHNLEGAVTKPHRGADVEVYIPKMHASRVQNKILPIVRIEAERMKAVAKKLGLVSSERESNKPESVKVFA